VKEITQGLSRVMYRKKYNRKFTTQNIPKTMFQSFMLAKIWNFLVNHHQ